jgi:hypothetical protein
MDMTEDRLRMLYAAWIASEGGGGVVLDGADLFVEAHELAEGGWLERRFVGDELAWFWSPQAETTLDTNMLLESVEGRQN